MKKYDENVANAIASVDVRTSYEEFTTLGDGILREPVTDTLTVDFWRGTDWETRIAALSNVFLGKAHEERDDRPTEVILHGPAVVTYFADGKRTMAKCNPDDRYRHVVGMLICALKRVCGKRDRVDDWEGTLAEVSRLSPERMRTLSKALTVAADMSDVVSAQASWAMVVSDVGCRDPKAAKALRGSKVTLDGDRVTVDVRRPLSDSQWNVVSRSIAKAFPDTEVHLVCGEDR